jgi:hypothetical protein
MLLPPLNFSNLHTGDVIKARVLRRLHTSKALWTGDVCDRIWYVYFAEEFRLLN